MDGKMRAFVITEPLKIGMQEVDIPKLEPHEVLIKVAAVGICTTDIELYDGSMSYYRTGLSTMPHIAGHEWSGYIAELGSEVKGFEVGDLVVGDVSIGCGKCRNCKRGMYHLCSERTEIGVIRSDGAMADYLNTDCKNIYKVPEGVSPKEAALIEPLAVVLNGLKRTGVEPGENVVVFGDGPIGLLNAQLANCCGAGKVAVVSRKEVHRDLVEKKWGMKLINSKEVNVIEAIEEYFGDLADVVFEDTGNPEVFTTAVMATAPGGRLCALSLTGKDTIPVPKDHITGHEITIYSGLSSPNCFAPALNLIAAGKIDVTSCISHEYPFEETREALEFVRNSHGQARLKVLICH